MTITAQRIVVMGVAGSGKSTLASALAEHLGWPFIEADDFHTTTNLGKMARGEALDDSDRDPWLAAVADEIEKARVAGLAAVVCCSALKQRYRDRLRAADPALLLVFLRIEPEIARARLAKRADHFMPASLVESQFGDLEPPAPQEHALVIEASWPISHAISFILVSQTEIAVAPSSKAPARPNAEDLGDNERACDGNERILTCDHKSMNSLR